MGARRAKRTLPGLPYHKARPEAPRSRNTSGRSVSDGARTAITPGIGVGTWGSMEKTGLPRDRCPSASPPPG